MKRNAIAVLAAVMLIALSVTGCKQYVPYPVIGGGDEGTVVLEGTPISSEAELAKAAAGYGKYYLTKDIIIDSQVTISGEITLDGNGHTITREGTGDPDHAELNSAILITASNVTLKNLAVDGLNTTEANDINKPEAKDWDTGEYALKAYAQATSSNDQIKIVLENVTIKDSNAGMLIKGAAVTLKGTTTLSNLEWGGFGVDSENNKQSMYFSTLNIEGSINYNMTEKPAIWTELSNAEHEIVTGAENFTKITGQGSNNSQTWYR